MCETNSVLCETSSMSDQIIYNLDPIRRAQELDYNQVKIETVEFTFFEDKLFLVLYDDISYYIKQYLLDLENDIYDTRHDIVYACLEKRYIGLDVELLDKIANNSSTSLSHAINNALDEVDRILKPLVIPRRERKEREDKLNSILRGE